MLTKNKLPLLIILIIGLEGIIYLWSYWTATIDRGNFFSIHSEFIFDKCARNSGRVASAINLIILLMIGYFGLKQIYSDDKKKDQFRVLITLFAFNHLIHFFFVFQTFNLHTMDLNISENKHGFITFMCIQLIPLVLWTFKKLNWMLYLGIILHLFNVSYFIMETFYNKIKPEKPAYHNQFGIVVTTAACLYVLYRVYRDYKSTITFTDDKKPS
jgi:hypothetical protein